MINAQIKIRDAISDLGNKVGSTEVVEQSAIGCFFGKHLVNFKLTEKQLKEIERENLKEIEERRSEELQDQEKKDPS